jgi:hypothetical protein
MKEEKKSVAASHDGCPDCRDQKVIQPKFSSEEEKFDPTKKAPEDKHIEASAGVQPAPSLEMFVIQQSNRISALEREALNQRKFNHETYQAVSSLSLQCNVLINMFVDKKVVTEQEIEEAFTKELVKHQECIVRMEEEAKKRDAGGNG